ncbi:MAG: hypothetical protein MJ252_08015 [archaeon]|nr:hypothetical protein [archaeon]
MAPVALEYYMRIEELIEQKDYFKIIETVVELVQVVKEAFDICLELKGLNVDWKKFGQCILNGGGSSIPELAMLVAYIVAQQWALVATTAISLIGKGIPLVVNCYNKCK